eukprot:Sspe_Gene.43870::Locus_21465_Transcript_1_1_Confidence_1.000_Length_561::g.43870::m.43870
MPLTISTSCDLPPPVVSPATSPCHKMEVGAAHVHCRVLHIQPPPRDASGVMNTTTLLQIASQKLRTMVSKEETTSAPIPVKAGQVNIVRMLRTSPPPSPPRTTLMNQFAVPVKPPSPPMGCNIRRVHHLGFSPAP